jgi:cytochrome c556
MFTKGISGHLRFEWLHWHYATVSGTPIPKLSEAPALYNESNKPHGGFLVTIPLAYSGVFLFVASLAIGFPAAAHGPSGHHETATAAHDEEAMKNQHERMGNFRAAMVALGEAVIHGNKTGAGEQATRLTDALRGHEKDVPHKNTARIKEFKGFYAELKNRIDRLSVETRSGDFPKIAVAYGRVLETCASCHAKFRD